MPGNGFDLKKEIALHTAWIVHDIHSWRKRKEIKVELSEHLEDAVYHYTLKGYSEREAFELAREDLGDSKKLQRLFAIVHNRDPFKWMNCLVMLFLIVITAFFVYFAPQMGLPYTLQSWLIFLSQLVCIFLSSVLIVGEYKYIRAFFKRVHLIGRLKRLCKEKSFTCHATSKAYLDLDNTANGPSFFVHVNEKTVAIRFAACLKKNDTYTFTDSTSYFTTNNANPIFVSFGAPIYHLLPPKTPEEARLYLPKITTLKNNDYIKRETIKLEPDIDTSVDTVNILCIHPLPAKLQVVRTNRAENIFDGDIFKDYTVYSGSGLCEYLKKL